MLGIVSWGKYALKIVWRNPYPVRPNLRRHTREFWGDRAFYVLQEFVDDGEAGHWATISDLEIVVGGRAA